MAALRSLVTSVRGQIDALTKEGNKPRPTRWPEGFTEFLDKIKRGRHVEAVDQRDRLPGRGVRGGGPAGQGGRAVRPAHRQAVRQPEARRRRSRRRRRPSTATFLREWKFLPGPGPTRRAGKIHEATALMKEIVGDPLKKGAKLGLGVQEHRDPQGVLPAAGGPEAVRPGGGELDEADGRVRRGGPGRAAGGRQVPRPAADDAGLRPGDGRGGLRGERRTRPGRRRAFEAGFKTVYPAVAERRSPQRQTYFDLYLEASGAAPARTRR